MFEKINILVYFLFILIIVGKELPPEFDKCKRDDNFDKCLVKAVNKALILLKDGNKEFNTVPLEPLEIKKLEIDSGNNAPIRLKQVYKNVKVYDLIKTSKILKYRTDLNKFLIICDSKSDRIEVIGDYEMNGRILLIPITGKGKVNLTLINSHIEHRLIGEPYKKDGVLYIKLKDYQVVFNPKRVIMNFENLFGDRTLSEGMNRFLNENWQLVFNELKSGYADSFGKIFKEITNNIFTKVPMDMMFLR